MSTGSLLIRAECGAKIGTGHVMRCLALAQAWREEAGAVVFAVAELPSALESRLRSEDFSVHRLPATSGTSADAESTIEIARQHAAEWVVIDGDHFQADFLRSLHAAGLRMLLLDDFAQRQAFPADLIVNPNLGATAEPYRRRGARATLCLGESYVLLRREFTSWRGGRVFPEKANTVLVTLGGSDPDGLTLKIVKALADANLYEIIAVAGPAYASSSELQRLASGRVQVLSDPPDMRRVMEQADIAVIAAGGTLWELLYMECAVLSYARNPVQAAVVEELDKRGAVRNMGAARDFDARLLVRTAHEMAQSRALRERMGNVGRRIVDGGGKDRVLRAMREFGGCA